MSGSPVREGRPAVTIVSPHFDDAPLSLGQSMLDGTLSRCRVRVEIAFGRTNFTLWTHPTRARAVPVSLWRRGEEAASQAVFRYRARRHGWEELVLRTGELDPERILDEHAPLDEELVGELLGWARNLRGTGATVVFPAGIGHHLDHRLLAEVGRRLWAEHRDHLGFYEDRPYAALAAPGEVDAHMADLVADLVPVDVSGPITERLHRLVRRCYPSQIAGPFIDAMETDRTSGARERLWFPAGCVPPWADPSAGS